MTDELREKLGEDISVSFGEPRHSAVDQACLLEASKAAGYNPVSVLSVPARTQTLEELRLIREENDRVTLKMQRRLDKIFQLHSMTDRLIRCGKQALTYVEDCELE